MARGWILATALVLFALKDVSEGAATEVSTPDKRFVQVFSPNLFITMMGVVVGKHYAVIPSLVGFDPDSEFLYNDLSDSGLRYTVIRFNVGVEHYALIKVCPGFRGYVATNMKENAFLPNNVNYTGEIYYHHRSDAKFYKETVQVRDDVTCNTGLANRGCLELLPCDTFWDNFNGNDYFVLPWILINGQPIGYTRIILGCAAPSPDLVGNYFAKLSVERDALVAVNPEAFEDA